LVGVIGQNISQYPAFQAAMKFAGDDLRLEHFRLVQHLHSKPIRSIGIVQPGQELTVAVVPELAAKEFGPFDHRATNDTQPN
jgi:hypothetical protein